MKESSAEQVRAALLEAVTQQIESGEPPETREAYERLLGQGCSSEEAMKYVACVLVEEVVAVTNEGREYDHQAYIAGLKALPKLPWE